MDRIVQNIIGLESSPLNSVLDRLSKILIEVLKSQNKEFGVWHTSQPYKKMIFLKYSLTGFENFLRDTKIIFVTNYLDIPSEELKYLESLQSKLQHLQNESELSFFKEKINTHWNWGQGFLSDEKNVQNSAVSLRPPINFGVRRVKSAVEKVSF
jgi:hypothetical protein